MIASFPTTSVGQVLLTYAIAFGSLGALAATTIRRGRRLARQVPDREKPWR